MFDHLLSNLILEWASTQSKAIYLLSVEKSLVVKDHYLNREKRRYQMQSYDTYFLTMDSRNYIKMLQNIWLHNDYGPTPEQQQSFNRCKSKASGPNLSTSCKGNSIDRTHT